MEKTSAGILEKSRNYQKQTKTKIDTLALDEVAWLFGVDNGEVEKWVKTGTITPCSNTINGIKRFSRKDVADLLAAFGA